MASISKLEEIRVWQESRMLIKSVFELTSRKEFEKEFFLKDQIKRSAISIMSNIAEGFGRGGNKEFNQFLYIANGSLNELKSQLYIAFDLKLIIESDLDSFLPIIFKIENMIKAFSRQLKNSEFTGVKFKSANNETTNMKQ